MAVGAGDRLGEADCGGVYSAASGTEPIYDAVQIMIEAEH
jgi:hypothetical protein